MTWWAWMFLGGVVGAALMRLYDLYQMWAAMDDWWRGRAGGDCLVLLLLVTFLLVLAVWYLGRPS